MIFRDEPTPGEPLPVLPGHSSPGRLERLLRSGVFAVTTELQVPDGGPTLWLMWREPTLGRLRELCRRAEVLKTSAPWIALAGPPLLFALGLHREKRA